MLRPCLRMTRNLMNTSLRESDPVLHKLIKQEENRQYSCLELIASENFTSQAVMEANGSCLTNKYSEGLPGQRYYGGNEFVDQIEELCIDRALTAFSLDKKLWAVNVQPYSGSPANFAAYTAFLKPHDRIMGLDLPSGGHLTHGFQTLKKRISASSIYFESMPYQVDEKTGFIDYAQLQKNAILFKPRMIICGASAYPRDWDYSKLREIANSVNAYLMCDMAHYSGLVAVQEQGNPFEFCDLVTTTTHKTLRGPRAGMIFVRKDITIDGESADYKINQAVFPGCQGGPHNHAIAGVATALLQVTTPEFKQYAQQVKKNSNALAQRLKSYGYKLVTDGTENHLVLWDLRPNSVTGSKMEKICDVASITLNKNSVHGDKSAMNPGGVRIGSPALTSRDFKEHDFEQVADFLHEACQLTIKIQTECGSKKLVDFVAAMEKYSELKDLKHRVEKFAKSFPMPGFDPHREE